MSRLNVCLREDKGYSYGVSSGRIKSSTKIIIKYYKIKIKINIKEQI